MFGFLDFLPLLVLLVFLVILVFLVLLALLVFLVLPSLLFFLFPLLVIILALVFLDLFLDLVSLLRHPLLNTLLHQIQSRPVRRPHFVRVCRPVLHWHMFAPKDLPPFTRQILNELSDKKDC